MSGADLAVLVPVLGRPHKVAPTLAGFERTAPGCTVMFLADPDDTQEIAALNRHGATYLTTGGNYAQKIRAGVEATTAPLIFTGADDLKPLDGWLKEAVEEMQVHGAEVVGVNDLINRTREHATHFLMLRDYAEQPTIDGQPGPFFEGYHHWYVDDELIATAKHRDTYSYAADSQIRHLHPMVGGEDDATYRKGREQRRLDKKLFSRRSKLWT